MFKEKLIFSFRKNKAVKTLCGAVMTCGLFLTGNQLISADEITQPSIEPQTNTQSITNLNVDDADIGDTSNTDVIHNTSESTATPASPTDEVSSLVSNQDQSVSVSETPSINTSNTVTSPNKVSGESTTPQNKVLPENFTTEIPATNTNNIVTSSNKVSDKSATIQQNKVPSEASDDSSIAAIKQIEKTSVSQTDSTLNITYNEPVAADDKVLFAVWTQNQNQDDIRWYGATSNSVSIDLSKHHKEYGLYHIHTYISSNGKMIGKDSRTFTVATPTPVVTVNKLSVDTYSVVVSNVTKDVDRIILPIWTENNNQDDIHWYETSKDRQGNYTAELKVSNHNYENGIYNIHVYGISNITQKIEGLKAVKYNVVTDTVKASVSVSNHSDFTVTVTNVPTYIKEILLPTWTTKNNQDDIRWYNATATGNTYSKTISIANHKYETGDYNIHVYGKTVDGRTIGLTTTKITVPNVAIKTAITDKGNNQYEVTVSNVPSYYTSLSTPIWSSKDNQDDIRWYSATKNANGTYTTLFDLKNHKNNIGDYNIHVYGTTVTGEMRGLASTTYTVKDLIVTPAKYSIGQKVEIQPSAVSETTGNDLTSKREWIGTVTNAIKNTSTSVGGWMYSVLYGNGTSSLNVLEQDLREVYDVALKTTNTKEQNNIALQQAMNYANANPNITLYLPQGDYKIGSNIQESDLGKAYGNEYIILASNTKLRGNDRGTNLIVDGTMLWFGLPTGTRGIDGVHDLVIDRLNVRANDLVNGDYFMIMLNHGNNITIKNSTFTMVQKQSRHILDLGGVQNVTIKNNKFYGYAPRLTNVSVLPSGADLHNFYAETIQIDASNNSGSWDASMIKNIAYNAYVAYNTSTSVLSSNINILNNAFLPYYNNGKLVAYSSTIGQHSSQVGNVFIKDNYFEKTLSKRYNVNQWFMNPIHYVNATGYKAEVSGNVIA